MQKAYCKKWTKMQLSATNIGVQVIGFKNFQEILTIEKKKYDSEKSNAIFPVFSIGSLYKQRIYIIASNTRRHTTKSTNERKNISRQLD